MWSVDLVLCLSQCHQKREETYPWLHCTSCILKLTGKENDLCTWVSLQCTKQLSSPLWHNQIQLCVFYILNNIDASAAWLRSLHNTFRNLPTKTERLSADLNHLLIISVSVAKLLFPHLQYQMWNVHPAVYCAAWMRCIANREDTGQRFPKTLCQRRLLSLKAANI